MNKKILITGAGGTPSTNFVRSLRESKEKFYFIGVDSNKYYLQRSETDERFLIPSSDNNTYISFLQKIIDKTKPDFIYSQPDQEIYQISKYRDTIKTKTFLPKHSTIEICQDKFQSYKIWKYNGLNVPKTIIINDEDDLKTAFEFLGNTIWIREIVSPGGGKGSFKATNINIAREWINYYNGWGNFTAAQCLTSNTVTWQSIWKNGKLIVAQSRKRLYWEFGNRTPSGVTGLTGAGITISDKQIDNIAQLAILTIDNEPHGIFSVDLTYDNNNIPNLTEINIGRFFTTHLFFTKAGLNMPYIYIKAAFDEKLPYIPVKINPLPQGLLWIRGLDFLPILTHIDKINNDEELFNKTLNEIQQ